MKSFFKRIYIYILVQPQKIFAMLHIKLLTVLPLSRGTGIQENVADRFLLYFTPFLNCLKNFFTMSTFNHQKCFKKGDLCPAWLSCLEHRPIPQKAMRLFPH